MHTKTRLSKSCPPLWSDLLLAMYNILDIGRHAMTDGVIIKSTSVEEYVRQLVLAFCPVLQNYGAEAKHFTELVEFG
ncbi:hypothetical protein EV179_005997, partial [Coemansia sp. RSA 487]